MRQKSALFSELCNESCASNEACLFHHCSLVNYMACLLALALPLFLPLSLSLSLALSLAFSLPPTLSTKRISFDLQTRDFFLF